MVDGKSGAFVFVFKGKKNQKETDYTAKFIVKNIAKENATLNETIVEKKKSPTRLLPASNLTEKRRNQRPFFLYIGTFWKLLWTEQYIVS